MEAFTCSQPFVRHLAWMLRAPRLLDHPIGFHPGAYETTAAWQRLAEWDRTPELAPPALQAPPARRLGHYFETLYRVLLEDVLGWQVLASNLPVRVDGRTLGELDLVVRDPVSGSLQHHEIAIKFYLGYDGAHGVRWYGPDARDRLDLKQGRLLQHQSRMTLLPATLRALNEQGIRGAVVPRVFLAGYLFQPVAGDLRLPSSVPPDHGRGQWLKVSQAHRWLRGDWVPLYKPDWLGPWQQIDAPDARVVKDALSRIAEWSRPGLFALLGRDRDSGLWVEKSRAFVVPESWPLQEDVFFTP